MPELVFFSGTMDCGKSINSLGNPPSLAGAADHRCATVCPPRKVTLL
ncbi:hypothetical protein [Streptomyces sp. NPDC058612]